MEKDVRGVDAGLDVRLVCCDMEKVWSSTSIELRCVTGADLAALCDTRSGKRLADGLNQDDSVVKECITN